MKRILSTLLAAAGILGLVMVAAVIFVTTFLDPEDLKPRLIDVVREQSGLELELDGPLSWSFYPRLGVSVDSAEARLPGQSMEQAPFAAFDHGEVSLSFAPLLRREIAIDGLTIVGLDLNLERDTQGRGNWETLLERLDGRRQHAESAIAPASAGFNPGGADLDVNVNIASVKLQDGRVRYADAQTGDAYQLSNLELAGTNVNPGSAFPLSGSVVVDYFETPDAESASVTSQLELKASVNLGLTERRHVLDGLSLKGSTRFHDEKEPQEFQLTAEQLGLDLAADQLQMKGGQLQAGLLYPWLGDKRLAFEMQFGLEANLEAYSARLQQATLTGPDGLSISGNLLFEALDTAPRYSGQLQLAPFSLRDWLVRFDSMPDMAKPEALSKVSLISPIKGDLEALSLDGFNLTLNGSTFSGRLAGDLDGKRLEASLQGDHINLDDYLPAGEATADVASLPGVSNAMAAQEGGQDAVELLPAKWLADVALDLQLNVGDLVLAQQVFRDVRLVLEGSNGVHELTEFAANFHSGELSATGQLDAREQPLEWALTFDSKKLRLASLLASLGHEPAPAEGRLSGHGDLTSQGNSVPRITRGLNGQIELAVDEGRLTQTNVSRQLCSVVASLEGKQINREWSQGTPFEQATASVDIKDGIASTQDLVLNIPGISIEGSGELDLGSEMFDLRVGASFSEDVDPACKVNPRLMGVNLPMRCKGQLGENSSEWCRVDRAALQNTLGKALQQEIRRRFGGRTEKELDRAAEKMDETLGEGAASGLRNAIKGLLD